MRKKKKKIKFVPEEPLSFHRVAAASHLSLRRSDHYVCWMSVCAETMHIKARCCISVRLPAAQNSMKIFSRPSTCKPQTSLLLTLLTLLQHSWEEWWRSCSCPVGLVTDWLDYSREDQKKIDQWIEGSKQPWGTHADCRRSPFQSSDVSALSVCVTLPDVACYRSWVCCCSCGGGAILIGSWRISFSFSLFCFFLFRYPKSQICTRKRSMLIICPQQVMMKYCESHESVTEIKPGEPVRSGVRQVLTVSVNFHWVFTK